MLTNVAAFSLFVQRIPSCLRVVSSFLLHQLHYSATMEATEHIDHKVDYHGDSNGSSNGAPLTRQVTVTMSPDQYERLFFSPTGPAKGDYAKRFGNPTLLGLICFLIPYTSTIFILIGWGGAVAPYSLVGLSGDYVSLSWILSPGIGHDIVAVSDVHGGHADVVAVLSGCNWNDSRWCSRVCLGQYIPVRCIRHLRHTLGLAGIYPGPDSHDHQRFREVRWSYGSCLQLLSSLPQRYHVSLPKRVLQRRKSRTEDRSGALSASFCWSGRSA